MKTGKILVLTFAFSALPAVAFAADITSGSGHGAAGQQQWPSFERLDSNNSGFIEQGEDAGAPQLGFKISDTDDDGRLSRQEYESASRGNPMPPGGGGGGNPSVR